MSELSYLTGFNNEHETQALPNALPQGQFSPQRCAYGLYAEQFSTTAFTMSRHQNRRTWMYRIRPSAIQGRCSAMDKGLIETSPSHLPCSPNPMRWDPLPFPNTPTDFIAGMRTIAVNGDARLQTGCAIHTYHANQSMTERYFYNADGELLIVPQQGVMEIYTELGRLQVNPGEIAVIPRGLKFKVELVDDPISGYICENYGMPYTLPERGPVGANGFANQRDFQYPQAWYQDKEQHCQLVSKFAGQLYTAELTHCPLDVVAWVGNSAPYKYDLSRFNVINSVSFDHPDPSIFTVLTSPSEIHGAANIDFVIFPPRWMVAENTFRPPWYHRNVMSEFMGLVQGVYDAKKQGFLPGGMSLHNCMVPHGPDAQAFEKASDAKLSPQYYQDTLAIMFESRFVFTPTDYALNSPNLQQNYPNCWRNLSKHFDASRKQ